MEEKILNLKILKYNNANNIIRINKCGRDDIMEQTRISYYGFENLMIKDRYLHLCIIKG